MKLQTRDIENFVQNYPVTCRVFLFYGPDEGQSRLRAKKIIHKKLGDKPDPFALVELQQDEILGNPDRLLDEAQSLPLGGNKKVIYIRQATDAITPILQKMVEAIPNFSSVLLEAGELTPKSSLRALCEHTELITVAIPAYDDDGRGLEQFAQQYITQQQRRFGPGAWAALQPLLSGNRALNTQILDTLLLYTHPAPTITAEAVSELLVSQANLALDDAVYAAFSGKAPILQQTLRQLAGEGVAGIPLLRATARHALRLQWVQSLIKAGMEQKTALKMPRPAIFFKRESEFLHQMRRYSPRALLRIAQKVQQAEIMAKTGYPADELAAQTLYGICLQANATKAAA